MAMIPSNLPPAIVEMAKAYTQERFEAWAKQWSPPYPLGTITINGAFDRYFDPQTQAAWEGFSDVGRYVACNHLYRSEFRPRMLK